jgi:hypothetical protein
MDYYKYCEFDFDFGISCLFSYFSTDFSHFPQVSTIVCICLPEGGKDSEGDLRNLSRSIPETPDRGGE